VTIRTTVELKTNLNEKAKGLGFDSLSHLFRFLGESIVQNKFDPTKIDQLPSGAISKQISFGISSEVKEEILSAIELAKEDILNALVSFSRKQKRMNEREIIDNIVHNILVDLDLREASQCKTDVELGALFKTDFHRRYIYDVIKQLEQEDIVSYRHDKLYWNLEKIKELDGN